LLFYFPVHIILSGLVNLEEDAAWTNQAVKATARLEASKQYSFPGSENLLVTESLTRYVLTTV
jgi:hypothetical protein